MSAAGVAVIGAGASGLSAAWRLAVAGHRVVLYERRALPGGLMRSDVVDGVVVDVGAQMLGSTYRSTLRLAREVGAGSLLVRSPGRDALWHRGRPHTITYGSISSMATSNALRARLKLKLVSRYLPFVATRCRGLDANDLAGTGGAAFDGESIAEWGAREMGDEFVEMMAYPFLGAYHAVVPERTSAAFYHGLARLGMDVELYAVMGGLGRLAFAVMDAIEVRGGEFRGGVGVSRLDSDGTGVTISLETGETVRHEAAVVAVPGEAAAKLVGRHAELASWLGRVESSPFISVAVVLDRPVHANFFGLGFPRIEPPGDRLVVACVESQKAPGMVPEGEGLLVAFPAPARVPALLAGPPGDLPSEVLPALDMVFGDVSSHAKLVKAYRHPEGHTMFYPGYVRHLLTFREEWQPPRIALAGDYLVAPTIEGAVTSGERAAVRVAAWLGGR